MPTYEYKCDACGNGFERFQSITAEPIRKCPKCGKLKVRRMIGPGAGIIFKGSGFYITDYRSDGYKKAEKESAGSKESTGDSKASSGDSKAPAASAESKPKSESKSAPKGESKKKK
jgi:putative FmdB family regulatory protein